MNFKNNNMTEYRIKWMQQHIYFLLLIWMTSFSGLAQAEHSTSLEDNLLLLAKASYQQKENIIESISSIDDPRSIVIFKEFLAGKLYYRKSDGKLVSAIEAEQG